MKLLGVNYELLNTTWREEYQFMGTPVWDSARCLKPDMYRKGGENSFLADAYAARQGDYKAQERINSHQEFEARDDDYKQKKLKEESPY